jgi:rRNA-processing protein EBP2
VALDDAAKLGRSDRKRSGPEKRDTKDKKFGFGGKKRFAKSGDATSTGDMRGFSAKGMKSSAFGGSRSRVKQRPGKSKRQKV